jgi:hypothetical protein
MCPLGNYVILQSGVPERMHFTDDHIEVRTVTDNVTLKPKQVNVQIFSVDQLNGAQVAAQFSTMSESLYAKFAAYLPNQLYRNYDFIVTQNGTGYTTRYTVQAIPRTK